MREENDTVRYSARQIKAKITRGEDRTDGRKARALSGKKLEASIKADEDDIHAEPDWTQVTIGVGVARINQCWERRDDH
ncbi:MAG: hypothetical protein WB676_25710 [Bryobacteraceae bacterium]